MLRIIMEDKNAPLFGIISHSALERLLETPFASPWYGQLMQRPQTMVYLLQIAWWLEHYCVQIV
jgi:asparagine synthase (glutamine-hydrolysing)